MMSRLGLIALCSGVLVVATGCRQECEDVFDCLENNDVAPEGREFVCEQNRCVLRDVTPGEDAGETDAGEEPDGGGEMDAGGGKAKDEACAANAECGAGLWCEEPADGGSASCQSLYLAYTIDNGAGAQTRAAVVRWDEAGSHLVLGDGTTRGQQPRFSSDGKTVAFQQAATGSSVELVTQAMPFTSGTAATVIVDAADAGTDTFSHLEWAPGPELVWSRTSGGSISGLFSVPGTPAAPTEITMTGVFPAWRYSGDGLVYSAAGGGLSTVAANGSSGTAITGSDPNAIEPQVNAGNDYVAYRVPNGTATISGNEQPLDELWTIARGGGTATKVAELGMPSAVTGGELRSFIANHAWAPNGRLLAFQRAWYFVPTGGGANTLCPGSQNECGRDANEVVVVQIDPATGNKAGDETVFQTNAALPSFSPDSNFLAYVLGGALQVQQIDPMTGTKVGTVVAHPQPSPPIRTNLGDDSRPRWQPK